MLRIIEARRILAAIIVLLALFFFTGKASAGTLDNGVGWLWGASQDGNDGNYTGVGWISLNCINTSSCSSVDYGVKFPLDGSPASGYGWSENLGWISFNETDIAGCPSGTCTARIEGESLKGWARVLGVKEAQDSGNSGGWSGFINLDRVTFASISGITGGYGWNGENNNDPPLGSNEANGLGWIDFSRAGIALTNPPEPFSICRNSCDSGVDLSRSGLTVSIVIGDNKNLKACYNSFGCLRTDPLTDVTSISTWAEEPGNVTMSLSPGPNDRIATADNEGTENITATYGSNQASVHFSASSFAGVTCWKCNDSIHSCSSEVVMSGVCSGDYFDSEINCNKACGLSSWKEVSP